ncbi:MAG: M12 family metallo-peptidase [Chitinophagaceae bacterium]
MKIRYLLTFISFVCCLFCSAQVFSFKNLFQHPLSVEKDYHDIASSYQLLQLDNQQLSSARAISAPKIEMSLPFENASLALDLQPATITSSKFSVIAGDGVGINRPVAYTLPRFYQGKIKGQDKSFATLSMFSNQMIGIMADQKSNIILGAVEQNKIATNKYAIYRDIDLKVKTAMNCFTGEIPVDSTSGFQTQTTIPKNTRVTAVGQPIEIYFECDYKFYQDKGSNVTNVVNYVLSFFNSVALLYANEGIEVQVSQIKVWTTPDPYTSLTTTSDILTAFGNNMATDPYVGDYAHFLSTRSLGGGIAYLLNSPCASSRKNHAAVSAVDNTYKSFPTYSWTVEVVTHELGHNFGSNHTHWCGWPGGPIDGCGPTYNSSYQEGTCAIGPIPPKNGGTIMSYCHLLSNVGISLANGFGTLPGDKIRSVIGAATCLGNCKMTMTLDKVDASCSQNNGSIVPTTTNGTGAISYLWSNGATSTTLASAAPGIYTVTATDAAGCKVMGIDTIVNTGSTLAFTLTPSGTSSFCSGTNITLSATSSPSYTYQWSLNGSPISSAIQSTYTTNTAGTYSVMVSSGACSATKSVVLSQVTQPSATISYSGLLNFCAGSSITLNANPSSGYQYQWYNNGVAISSATNNTYNATIAGNYSVRVYSGSCESTSASVSVNVESSPQAAITAAGPLSFCNGLNVSLSTPSGSGYTYQWYRNNTAIDNAIQRNYTASISGSYTVVASLGSCSKTSAASTVTVFSLPTVTITPDSSVIGKFHSQTLTAGGANTYSWDKQGTITNGGSNNIVAPLTTTSYVVNGTDNNGCTGSAIAKVIVIGCGDATQITSTVYSPSRVIVKWVNPQGASSDSIRYRLKGSQQWTTAFVNNTEYEINGLTPATDYEYQLIPLCTTTSTFVASDVQEFHTSNLSSGIYLKLYPNPVSQSTRVEIIIDKPFSLQVDIYNKLGQKVITNIEENLPAGQVIKLINAYRLSPGIYHVAVTINGKKYVLSMVVQH